MMSSRLKFYDVCSRGVRSCRRTTQFHYVSNPLAPRTVLSWRAASLPGASLFSDNLQVKSVRDYSTSLPTNPIASPTKSSGLAVVDESVQALKFLLESGTLHAPQNADEILQQLEDRKERVSFECLSLAIECWSRTKRKGAEERIEQLYHQLCKSFQTEVTKKGPNPKQQEEKKIQMETAMIRVLKAYHHVCNAHRAEDLLIQCADNYRSDSLFPPTLAMCKSVLYTWSKSDSSRRATRAEKLLSLMSKDPVLPDPDITCYTMVLNCWASSGKDNAPQRAELLLRSMEFAEGDGLRPNLVSYSCILNAWSRSKALDAPEQAERLLQEMVEVKGWVVDRVVYAAMISVWGRSKRPESITKAEEYFQRLQSLQASSTSESDKPLPKATVVEYTALIQAWADHVRNNVNESQRAVDRVEYLLDQLVDKYYSSKFDGEGDAESMRPNRMTFASVFRTIGDARSIPDREDRANRALEVMKSLNLKPTTYLMHLVEKCSPFPDNETTKPNRNF